MTRIVCVGITVLDRIWYLDDLPKEGGKYVAKDYTEVGGGPAATAAVAAAKLGASVDFIGRVGDDDTGRRLLAELESLGEHPLHAYSERCPLVTIGGAGGRQRGTHHRELSQPRSSRCGRLAAGHRLLAMGHCFSRCALA